MPATDIDWQSELKPVTKKTKTWAKFQNPGDAYEGMVVRYQELHGAYTRDRATNESKPCGVLIIDPIATPDDPDRTRPEQNPDNYVTIALDKTQLIREVKQLDPLTGQQIRIEFVKTQPGKNPYPAKIFEITAGDRPPEGSTYVGSEEPHAG